MIINVSYYAVEELKDSFNNAKELLFPIDAGTWMRLGLLVIFTGSGMSMPNFPTGGYGDSGYDGDLEQTSVNENPELEKILNETSLNSATAAFGAAETAALAGIAVTVIFFVILWLIVSSIFQFVYYQSLIDEKVRIISNSSKHLGDGLRYMVLQLLSLVLTVGLVAGIIAGLFINPLISILAGLGILLLIIPVSIIMGLVNDFVVPETINTNQNFWKSLKTGLGKARNELNQTIIYILVRFGVKIITGMAMMLYMLSVLVVLLLVFGILGAILYFITPILVAIPVIIGLIVFVLAIIAGQVVVQTFLNYYALNVFENFGEQ